MTAGAVDVGFAYTGAYQEAATGDYALRARDYQPATGRFTSIYPMPGPRDRGAGQPYVYAAGNPLVYTDPSGMCPEWVCGTAAAVGHTAVSVTKATAHVVATVATDEVGYLNGCSSRGQIGSQAAARQCLNVLTFGSFTGCVEDHSAVGCAGLALSVVPDVGSLAKLSKAACDARKAKKVADAANAGGDVSQILLRSPRSLQAKFKHAGDFGVAGNYSKANAAEFSAAINQHINAAGTRAIQGTYRGQSVTHYLDSSTGLNVISRGGEFVSGWKLSPEQLANVLRNGSLGGG